jgi:Ca2+-binding RTX toxin-like protein
VKLPYDGPAPVLKPAAQTQSTALRAILSGLETSTTPIPQAAIDNEDYGFHPEDDANDFVYGGSGIEVLFDLGGGDDSFFGYGGNDGGEYKSGYFGVIFGGSGADEMYGGDGNDEEFNRNDGNDHLEGGQGQDSLFGNGGTDTVEGEYDTDNPVNGGDGNNDSVAGGPGDQDWGGGGPGTSDSCSGLEHFTGGCD